MQKDEEKKELYIRVDGIYCEHCVDTVTTALKALDGVEEVSLRQNVARIYGNELPSRDKIIETIRKAGYETDESSISPKRANVAKKIKWYELISIVAVLILSAYGINRAFGYNIFNAIPAVDSGMSYWMLFVTGLLTSIHCIGMCGAIGIYASSEKNSVRSLKRPLLYNAGRLVSYTAIGGIAGLVGSVFSVSAELRGVVILIASLLMLFMSLSMLGLLRFRLPRFFGIKLGARRTGAFIIGLLNGLMPCGPLQAMQIYALSTGSFLSGALSMFLFALGTIPLMLASGAVLNLARGKAKIIVGKVAPVLMLVLSVSMLNRGLLAFGADVSNILPKRYDGYISAVVEDGIQTVEFELDFDSYADIIIQKDIPARITVHADEGKITGCNNEIISREFGFDIPIVPGDNIIEFTPNDEGEFTYTCWMNMIRNHIKVIDDREFFNNGD